MEEGSCWSFEVKSLLSVEMSLRLIVNFYGITTASSSILLGAFYHPPGTGSIPLNQLHHPPYLTHDLSSCVVTSIFQAERLNHSDLILDRCLTQLAQQPTRGESILDLLQTHRVWFPRLKSSVLYLAVIVMLFNFQLNLPNPPWLGITVSPMTLKRLTLIDSETFSVRSPETAAS